MGNYILEPKRTDFKPVRLYAIRYISRPMYADRHSKSGSVERNRLVRDIHDSLGHHLTAANIQLEKAGLFLERDLGKSATAIDHAQRTIRQALNEVRTSVQALREQASQFDLVPELHDLVGRMSHHNLVIDFKFSGDTAAYSTFIKMTIYRIVQEGLTNIHKHAAADRATVDLAFDDQQAILTIGDNGQGFDLDTVPL